MQRGARTGFGAAFCLVLGACASLGDPAERAYTSVAAFSAAEPGGPLPGGWQPWTLSRFKRSTQYQLVRNGEDRVVLHATADASASGLVKRLDLDPASTPWLSWRWKVPALIGTADNTRRDAEDSPVRIVVSFEGDPERLDFEERAFASRVKAMTGRDMPYATLMYIWENRQPVGEVIASGHTSRVRMVVAESGAAGTGKWLEFTRNVAEDFRRAYGEEPGRIRSIGLMTDTDNTGEATRAYYGDIKFSAARPTHGVISPLKEKS